MPSIGAAGLASELEIAFLSIRCCAALPIQAAHSPRLAAGRVQIDLRLSGKRVLPIIKVFPQWEKVTFNPNVAKAGGLQSQGAEGDAVVLYCNPLATRDLESSRFPERVKT